MVGNIDSEFQDITCILKKWGKGNKESFEQLITITYPRLLKLSKKIIKSHSGASFLCPHELLHESFFRLRTLEGISWENRRHFYNVTSKLMKHVFLDKLRFIRAEKRGGEFEFVEFNDEVHCDFPVLNSDIGSILNCLGESDKKLQRILYFRYVEGYSVSQIGGLMNYPLSKVKSSMLKALALLRKNYL